MANKVNNSPAIGFPQGLTSIQAIDTFLTGLVRSLVTELQQHAVRLNAAAAGDSIAVADLPDPATMTGQMVFVPDETGGATMAFSDGSDWRRVQDRAVVS